MKFRRILAIFMMVMVLCNSFGAISAFAEGEDTPADGFKFDLTDPNAGLPDKGQAKEKVGSMASEARYWGTLIAVIAAVVGATILGGYLISQAGSQRARENASMWGKGIAIGCLIVGGAPWAVSILFGLWD